MIVARLHRPCAVTVPGPEWTWKKYQFYVHKHKFLESSGGMKPIKPSLQKQSPDDQIYILRSGPGAVGLRITKMQTSPSFYSPIVL